MCDVPANHAFMSSMFVFSTVLAASYGCGNAAGPGKGPNSHDAIQAEIERLGGEAEFINDAVLKRYGLPQKLNGFLGGIQMSYLDISGVDIEPLLPRRSLVWADFDCTDFGDSHIDALVACTQLRAANLAATKITDRSLARLGQLPSLTRLDLSYCNVTDKGLESLAKCKSLSRLYFTETHVTKKGIENLKRRLPQLRKVSWSQVSSEEVRSACTNLKQSGAIIRSFGVTTKQNTVRHHITFLPNPVPRPAHGGWRYSPKAAGWLETIVDSDSVRLNFRLPTKHTMQVFKELAELKSVSEVQLRGHLKANSLGSRAVFFQDDDLKVLPQVEIEHLILSTTSRLTPAGLKHVAGIKGLKTLTLEAFPYSQESLEAIAACRELEKVTLSRSDLSGVDFNVFAKAKALKVIEITEDCKNVDKKSLQELLKLRADVKFVETEVR